MADLVLDARMRRESHDGTDPSEITTRPTRWNPEKGAVVICDMWDAHHCVSAAKRTAEMAPRMNEVVTQIREQGTLIIHSPCACMEFYKDTPQRQRTRQASRADAPCEFGWNGWDTWREVEIRERFGCTPLPNGLIEIGPCSCHAPEPCCEEGPGPWTRQIETIEISDEDAVTSYGETDDIIEYIETFWCPTVTSDQIVGGETFRFRDDKRERI